MYSETQHFASALKIEDNAGLSEGIESDTEELWRRKRELERSVGS